MPRRRLEVRKHIFQIRLENPLYLDKTGAFIAQTRDIFTEWTKVDRGFRFVHKNRKFYGGVSMEDFHVATELLTTHDEVKAIALKGLEAISVVYDSPVVKRVGYRIIALCELHPEQTLNVITYLKGARGPLEDLIKASEIDRMEVFLRYKLDEEHNVNLRTLYGSIEKRKPDNLLAVERISGLIVDIDFAMTPASVSYTHLTLPTTPYV